MNIIQKISRIPHMVWMMIAAAGVACMPVVALAQADIFTNLNSGASGASTLSQTNTLNDLVTKTIQLFNVAIYLIVALAILTFVWNVYQYFIVKDPENRKEAGAYVMYSVIGIFVILSFWGLVNIISNTLNIDTDPGSVNVGNLIGNITGGTSASSLTPNLSSPSSAVAGSAGYSSSAYQQAYQAQANSYQQGLYTNNCYTTSGGIVNTPSCQSLYSQYVNAQSQATLYGNQSVGGTSNASQLDTNFDENCLNGAGNAITLSSYCQGLESQIQAEQNSNGDSCTDDNGVAIPCDSGGSGDNTYTNPSSDSSSANCFSLDSNCDVNGNPISNTSDNSSVESSQPSTDSGADTNTDNSGVDDNSD